MNFQILIPTYNSEKYIAKTIESVLNQTYNNYQIHIIDDKSSDNTIEIANKYLSNEKVRIYKNDTNFGKFKSINNVLKKINGDCFLILDGHDLMYPNRLELENNIFEENPEILCVQSKVKKIDELTNKIISTDKYNYTNETYSYEVIKKIGLFNENRFGGNIEYLSRFIKFIGENNLFKINKILTTAIKRTDKLNLGLTYSNEYIENFISKMKKLHLSNKKEFFKTYKNDDLEKDNNIELDLEFYKKSYLDLENMTNKQLKSHWDTTGKKEGRLPNAKLFKYAYPNFDFNLYLKINPYNINFKSNYDIYGWIYLNDNSDYYDWLKSNGYVEMNNKTTNKEENKEFELNKFIEINKIMYIYISKKISEKEKNFIDKIIKHHGLNIYNQETDSYENVLFYGLYDKNDYNIICLNNNKIKYLLWSSNYESFKDEKYYDNIFTQILKYYNIKHLIIDNKIQKIFSDIKKSFYKINVNQLNLQLNMDSNKNYVKENNTKIKINESIEKIIKLNNNNKYFDSMLLNIDKKEKDIVILKKYIPSTVNDKNYFENSIKFFTKKNLLIGLYENNEVKKSFEQKYLLKHQDKIISIIMSHRNRPDLLFVTLLELNKSTKNNFEVIIVDDRSDDNLKPNFIKNIFYNYPIKLISIENKDNVDVKCSSEVYNMAFENSIGDIIIIQNPECLHFGDLPNYILKNFKYDDYICFPCFSSNNLKINDYIIKNKENINMTNIEDLVGKNNKDKDLGNFINWYQHKIKNDRCLHFCTVISRNYFRILKGFDPIYKDGFCFEDDDLIYRIRNIIKLNVISLETNLNIGVVHMYHGRNKFVNMTSYNGDGDEKLAIRGKYKLNQNILNYLKDNDNKISCPKIFHYYWDDFRKFSFMNLYSLRTSLYYHPDYIHIIWTPTKFCEKINWKENLNNNFVYDENYEKYIQELKNYKNLSIIKLDVNKFLGVSDDVSEIHKSDILRYVLLNKFGGIWSDLDIVYIKKITNKINFDFENLFFKCINGNEVFYPIGLLLCKKNTLFMNNLLDKINKYYNKNKYQCIGAEMLKIIFTNKNYNDVYFLENEFYMNYLWHELDELFIDYKKNKKDLKNTIGFHWFNGSNITKKYISNIKNEIIKSNYNGILFIEKNKFLRKINF